MLKASFDIDRYIVHVSLSIGDAKASSSTSADLSFINTISISSVYLQSFLSNTVFKVLLKGSVFPYQLY